MAKFVWEYLCILEFVGVFFFGGKGEISLMVSSEASWYVNF